MFTVTEAYKGLSIVLE